MAIRQVITPFPADINRDYFGAWVSGFVDGEGCFYLGASHLDRNTKGVVHSLSVCLRSDDVECLQLMQSFFQCGHITPAPSRRNNQNPGSTFRIANIHDLMGTVIPHFDKFPLIAKKKHDYEIWKLGIRLVYSVSSKRCVYLRKSGGKQSKWTTDEWEQFLVIMTLLREQRVYFGK